MSRALTALVLIPTVLYVIFGGPPWLFQLVICLLSIVCFREFAFIAQSQNIAVPVWLGHALGLAFLLLPSSDWRIVIAMALLLAVWSMRLPVLSHALPAAAVTLFGILYTYGAWRCAPPLRDASPWWLAFAVSINWVGDSAAYFTGRAIGKHKMAPVLSPKKTWEGAAGSLLCCTAFGTFLIMKMIPQTPIGHAVALSVAACVAGQLGDLVESAMKRGANVKDSGTMLPGHGGWLDRLDSTLFSMPVVLAYLSLRV